MNEQILNFSFSWSYFLCLHAMMIRFLKEMDLDRASAAAKAKIWLWHFRTLLLKLVEKGLTSKHPQLMLRRTESIVEKMLTNWLVSFRQHHHHFLCHPHHHHHDLYHHHHHPWIITNWLLTVVSGKTEFKITKSNFPLVTSLSEHSAWKNSFKVTN